MKPPFFVEISDSLCESVRHTIRWHCKDENGETKTERNARFSMSYLTPDDPEIPDYIAYIWIWFWELSSRRRSSLGGGESIAYGEITQWIAVTCSDPTQQEIGVLLDMDNAYLSEIAEIQKEKKEKDNAEF